MTQVSIVVPVFIRNQHTFQLTNGVLAGLIKTQGINDAEILVVDDGSDQKWMTLLKKLYPNNIRFLTHSENRGFASAVNTGITASKNDWVLLLNNDVEILQYDWLVHFISETEKLGLSVSAPKESWLDENWNYIPDSHRHCCKPNFTYAVGWALLVRREVFQTVGLIPQNFGKGFFEETLWAWEIKTKYPKFKIGAVFGLDHTKLSHKEHQTFKAEKIDIGNQYEQNRKLFLEFIGGKKKIELPQLESRN